VFASVDGEVDVMEDNAVTKCDMDVAHMEKGMLGGFGTHLIC
jgi:hypothetical protein